ncbi:MAG: ATP-binding protein [Deltaproteobacteria bacterium]|nr:ATP-binding protein [Deltaproteobacteria bacterium]
MDTVAGKIFNELRQVFAKPDAEAAFEAYCRDELTGVESTYFDYKRSEGLQRGTLARDDQKNLAKALSGFANTAGGVLIWGVEERDAELSFTPIPQLERFAAKLMDLVGKATDPPVAGVDRALHLRDDGSGYICLLIPESDLHPHQLVLQVDGNGRYYGRAGTDFRPLPHSMLADRFGRRPHPKLEAEVRGFVVRERLNSNPRDWALDLRLANRGRGMANELAICMAAHGSRSGDRPLQLRTQSWQRLHQDDSGRTIWTPSAGRILHAGAVVCVSDFHSIGLMPGEEITVALRIFAEGIAPVDYEATVPAPG